MDSSNEEIDLIEVLRKSFSFMNKNKWILIVVLIGGLVLGYYQTKKRSDPSNAYYRTQFIINSSFIDNNEIYMIGRDLSYEVINSEVNANELYSAINDAECTKDIVAEGQEPEVNIVFETSKSIDVKQLSDLIKKKISANENFKKNYGIELQYNTERLKLLNNQLSRYINENDTTPVSNDHLLDPNKDPGQLKAYLKLLDMKEHLEKKMIMLDDPIQCYPIAPLNKLYEAPKFSMMLVLLYGFILSAFSALLIVFIRIIKQALS